MNPAKQYILSIQSLVSTGFVGNNTAVFTLQSFGIDVVMLPTVLFSTHADENEYYGDSTSVQLFSDLIKGIQVSKAYKNINTALTGYINSIDLILLTASFLENWKKTNTFAFYIYDPVFGDTRTGGLYIDEVVVQQSIVSLLPIADVLTPNHFELEYLLGKTIETEKQLRDYLIQDQRFCDKKVVLTSAELSDIKKGSVETILIENGQVSRFLSERIAIDVVGTGDLFNACLSAFLERKYKLQDAIPKAMSLVRDVLKYVDEQGLIEINAAALCHVFGKNKDGIFLD